MFTGKTRREGRAEVGGGEGSPRRPCKPGLRFQRDGGFEGILAREQQDQICILDRLLGLQRGELIGAEQGRGEAGTRLQGGRGDEKRVHRVPKASHATRWVGGQDRSAEGEGREKHPI